MKAPTFKLDEENLLIVVTHDCPAKHPLTGEPAGKSEVELPIGAVAWMVISNDPLTVVGPDITCERCDLSGTITDGKWVKS